MYDVFVFFIKDHESAERKFFDNKCSRKEVGLRFVKDEKTNNYYFFDTQNDLFTQVNEDLIDHINNYCKRIRNFLKSEKEEDDQRFIIAVHPPDSKGSEELLEWQKRMKDINKTANGIVYYSSKDCDNVYLKIHKEFKYDYDSLFPDEKKTSSTKTFKKRNRGEGEFNIFLNLLKLRTGRKEIDFFDVKKKLDDLYHIFFVKALVCKGILECIESNRDGEARTYYLKSLGNETFQTIVTQLKESTEVKNLEDVKSYNARIYNSLQETLEKLNSGNFQGLSSDTLEKMNKGKLKGFLKWYINFLKTLKDSLKEVEKGGN